MDDLRGSPLSVGTLEEMIDDNHAIVSSSVGPEYYVNVLSFVNQDLLEPGSSVLLHNKASGRCTIRAGGYLEGVVFVEMLKDEQGGKNRGEEWGRDHFYFPLTIVAA